tara:strand:- start:52 stop:270 length:219 start_codon:yes stop_codon:yes gene_type:complete
MNRSYIYCLLVIFLALTVPWFYSEPRQEHVFGFPTWAFYSFLMTVVFAVVITLIIQVYWDLLAGEEEEESEE